MGEIAAGPNPAGGGIATESQQTNVFRAVNASTGVETFVWMGDRWQSADDHLKGHDYTYWAPVNFLPNGSIARLVWEDTVWVDV